MIFEAPTFEEVYQKASDYFNQSISELTIKIIQSPSNGILGFFKKTAIIEIEEEKEIIEEKKNKISKNEVKEDAEIAEIEEVEQEVEEIKSEQKEEDNDISLSIEDVAKLAKKEIIDLFRLSCFEIDKIEVQVYNDETILFEIDGKDSALLIGKEGYRYNALATMLFSWISQKYGYKTKLEIASFLESQEEMMRKFLEPTIREIEEKGRCKTKSFDGVLVYIAVEILRQEFPDKYVAIKKTKDGSQYIIINNFLKKND